MRMTGTTRLVLEEVLRRPAEDHYGYDLVKVLGLRGGSLYPILERLQSAGWLESEWRESPGNRPRRRCYRLTAEGLRQARVVMGGTKASFRPGVAGA